MQSELLGSPTVHSTWCSEPRSTQWGHRWSLVMPLRKHISPQSRAVKLEHALRVRRQTFNLHWSSTNKVTYCYLSMSCCRPIMVSRLTCLYHLPVRYSGVEITCVRSISINHVTLFSFRHLHLTYSLLVRNIVGKCKRR